MTPATRYLCPLECGWHHDSRDLPDLCGLSGATIEDIIRAGVERRQQTDETAVREHLESHPLIEWVTEVARLQRELNTAVARSEAWSPVGESVDCGFPPVPPRKVPPAVQRQAAERFGFPLPTPATQVSAVAPGGNAEDCPRCSGTNPPYPFLCPGHPAVAGPATGSEERQ